MQTLIQTVNYYEHLDLKANVPLDTDIFVQQKFNCDVVVITPPHVVSQFKDNPSWKQLQLLGFKHSFHKMLEMVSYSWRFSFYRLQESRSLHKLPE